MLFLQRIFASSEHEAAANAAALPCLYTKEPRRRKLFYARAPSNFRDMSTFAQEKTSFVKFFFLLADLENCEKSKSRGGRRRSTTVADGTGKVAAIAAAPRPSPTAGKNFAGAQALRAGLCASVASPVDVPALRVLEPLQHRLRVPLAREDGLLREREGHLAGAVGLCEAASAAGRLHAGLELLEGLLPLLRGVLLLPLPHLVLQLVLDQHPEGVVGRVQLRGVGRQRGPAAGLPAVTFLGQAWRSCSRALRSSQNGFISFHVGGFRRLRCATTFGASVAAASKFIASRNTPSAATRAFVVAD